MKRYLIEALGVPQMPSSPKPIFWLAHENNLSIAPVGQWLRYADARVSTSHDYDGKKAKACLALIPAFIDDAIGLYQTTSGAPWE